MREVLLIEQRRTQPPPRLRVPRAAPAGQGDPAQVDWTKAAELGPWLRTSGADTDQKLGGRLLHDGRFLYVQLEHLCDAAKLVQGAEIWDGDDWELFFAAQRGAPPYRQLALNPAGKSIAYEWENLIGKCKPKDWASGAQILSQAEGPRWTVSLALPLANLVAGGTAPGGVVYANFYRAQAAPKQLLGWSPNYEEGFHVLTRLAELTLE